MASKQQKWFAAGLAAAVVHVSGVVAGMEHDVSPGLAHTSLDLFHQIQPERLAGVTAIKEFTQGSDEDRIVARAACTFLSKVYSISPDQERNKEQILAEVPPLYQSNAAVQRSQV